MVELPCVACEGTCCTGHRGVLLDDGSILPFVNGRCPNLGATGRCGIYETRPLGCREFDCSREPGYLRFHPAVAALLTLHGVEVKTRVARPPSPSGELTPDVA